MNHWSTYQEMTLTEALNVEKDSLVGVVIDGEQTIEIKDEEFLENFSELINDYTIKRTREEFIRGEELENQVRFFVLRTNSKYSILLMTKSKVRVDTMYYDVLNGPIHIDEINQLISEYIESEL